MSGGFRDQLQKLTAAGLTRRDFFRRAALAGLSSPPVMALLSACGPGAPPAPTAAPPEAAKGKPTEPPKPAAPAPPAPAPKPAEAAKPAASPAAQAPAQAKALEPLSGPIQVGMLGDGRTLDPANEANINELHFLPAIFDKLIDIDENYNLKPSLARSWSSSPSGDQWTFTLQPGVKFHDGSEFNAEAVKFNYERLMDPANKLIQAAQLEPVKEIEVIDPLTIRLVLKEPNFPFPASLADVIGHISSPAAIKKFGAEYGANPVGTGPFQFVEWRRDSKLTLKRFDGYWRPGLPRAAGVVFQPIPDTAVKLTNLKSGTIDVVDEIDIKDVEAVGKDSALRVYSVVGSRWPMLRLNTTMPPFDKLPLRQAVSHAFNREAMVKGAFFGNAQPAYGPVSPIYKSVFDPNIAQYALTYDPAKAKQKLAEAGQPDGFSFVCELPGAPVYVRQAELIQNDLAQVGIKMDIRTLESAAFSARIRTRQFEGTLGSSTPRPDIDETIHRHFHTKGALNYTNYSNPKVDELLDKSRTLPPGNERSELFRQVQRILAVEVPWVTLVFESLSTATRATVQGFAWLPDTRLHLETVSVTDRKT